MDKVGNFYAVLCTCPDCAKFHYEAFEVEDILASQTSKSLLLVRCDECYLLRTSGTWVAAWLTKHRAVINLLPRWDSLLPESQAELIACLKGRNGTRRPVA